MGQKINPIIYRLGINKTWKTELFEKKRSELPLHTFKDLEIKAYVERFLETQGVIVHDYKQHYSDSTLNLYISYIVPSEFVWNLDKKEKSGKMILVNRSGKKKAVTNVYKFHRNFLTPVNAFIDSLLFFQAYSANNYYTSREYFRKYFGNARLSNQPLFSGMSDLRKSNGKSTNISDDFFKVLGLFTKNRFDIIVHFCCTNKDLNFMKNEQRKSFFLLGRFKNTLFLKEGIELLVHVLYSKNAASLLAKFVSLQIKKARRHKFFLTFLKQTLIILFNSSFSKIRGVKIIVKGRLNGVPRAKHKMLTIGDVPIQSIDINVDYFQTTVCNSNGSYGIKVWTIEK